jgi:hypothetical protein
MNFVFDQSLAGDVALMDSQGGVLLYGTVAAECRNAPAIPRTSKDPNFSTRSPYVG